MDVKAAGILVINKSSELLVLHRKANVSEGNKWGLPGGKVGGELTSLNTAILKTTNETGFEFNADNLKHLATFRFVVEGNLVIYDVWVAEATLTSNSKIDLNLEGHDNYKWEKPDVLLKQKDLMVGMYPILEKYLKTIKP